jgi:hypothetical protein
LPARIALHDLAIRGVRELEHELRTAEDRDRHRRVLEQLGDSGPLLLDPLLEPAQGELVLHAREQLHRRERLDQVVVRTRGDAVDARLLARTREQHDDRRRAQVAVRAQLAQQAKPVEVRHHHVGEHEIRRLLARELERREPVGGNVDRPVLAQDPREVIAHVGVVVDDEHALGPGRRLRHGRLRDPPQRLLDVAGRPRARANARAELVRGKVRRAERQAHRERRAAAELARRGDLAAVHLDDLVHEHEPDAGALVRAPLRARHAVEPLEHPRQLIGRDARAGVAHLDDRAVAVAPHDDADRALERELERVRDQVQHDLFPQIAVDVDVGDRIGVRNSWLTLLKNTVFARSASASARSRASCSARTRPTAVAMPPATRSRT